MTTLTNFTSIRRDLSRPTRPPRLPADVYADPTHIFAVTIGTWDERPVFDDAAVAAVVVETLLAHAQQTGIVVHAYCFLPAEVQLLLSPSERCDVCKFVAAFKSLALRACWQRGVAEGTFWRPSFRDHVLRPHESLAERIDDIRQAPVKAGLASSWEAYPFTGPRTPAASAP